MAYITNAEVFGLESSIFRSGYPMRAEAPSCKEYTIEVNNIRQVIERAQKEHNYLLLYQNTHINRAFKLAKAEGGGHDQFLTGIVVNFDLTLTNKAWVEAERYTFLNFISSMSTMHRISALPIKECCNRHVDPSAIELAEQLQKKYNETEDPEEKQIAYLDLLYNIPSGFELMAGMTTNYRCLKNIYAQRRNHRLPDWHVVCNWIETLPLAKYLICVSK